MNSENQVNKAQYIDDDEIDLVELVRFVFSKWKIWVGTSVLGGLLALIYVTITPPIYESWTTFFVPSEGNSALSKYASFLGAPDSGNLENQVMAIFESERLKFAISKNVYISYPELFQEKIKEIEVKNSRLLSIEEKSNFVKGSLDFRKQFSISKDKSGLFKLSSENKMPDVSLLVVTYALSEVTKIYNDLEIGAKKGIIMVLDPPMLKNNPVKPKKALMVLVSVFTSGLLGVFFSFFQYFFKKEE